MALFSINMMAQSTCCAGSKTQAKENVCAKVDDKKTCKKECKKQGECKQQGKCCKQQSKCKQQCKQQGECKK